MRPSYHILGQSPSDHILGQSPLVNRRFKTPSILFFIPPFCQLSTLNKLYCIPLSFYCDHTLMSCYISIISKERHLLHRKSHYPGTFQFMNKSVEKAIDNLLFLNIRLHLYRSKLHNIPVKRSHLWCICHVQVWSIHNRTSELIRKTRDRKCRNPHA